MPSKIPRFLVLLSISSILCIITYQLCYLVAEHYFFDKFFYKKSIDYGYPSKNNLSEYSLRTKDLIMLNENPSQLFKDDHTFNIAIFGDSYTYGQGIKNSNRFANILEKKLNKLRKTKVTIFSDTSRSPLDYLNWYRKIPHPDEVNLYIFALVGNDAFIRPNLDSQPDDKTGTVSLCQSKYPKITPVTDVSLKIYLAKNPIENINQLSDEAYEDSWSNQTNICVLRDSLFNLPTYKSIYFITDDYLDNGVKYSLYKKLLIQANKYIVSSSLGKEIQKYSKYWQTNPWTNFRVSNKEEHPNSLANQMYADVLYNEIISNPKFGFLNEK